MIVVIGGLLLLLLGTLSLPVGFAGRINLGVSPAGEMELAWAWGLAGARVAVAGRTPEMYWRLGALSWRPLRRGTGKKSTRGPKGGEEAGRKRSPRELPAFLGNGELLKSAAAYGRLVFRSLRLRLHLAGEFGTGEPALTGYLTAFLAAVSGGPVELQLSPDFTAACLDMQGELRGRLIPLRLMWLTGGFLLTRPVRRIWWGKITKRKKHKGVS